MMPGHLIRRATPDDAPALHDLGAAVRYPTYAPIAGDEYAAYVMETWWRTDYIAESMGRTTHYVAERDGRIVERYVDGLRIRALDDDTLQRLSTRARLRDPGDRLLRRRREISRGVGALAQALNRISEGDRRTRDFTLNALRKALVHLKKIGVDVEDPGDEIGPEAPGSKNMGLWFHDPDGYRWELSVLSGKREPRGDGF